MRKHPVYVWGGARSEALGLDCSGFIFLAAKRAAIPGISRQTSRNMALGYGGWIGRNIKLDEAEETDLLFWTWRTSPQRRYGHVGAVLLGERSGLLEAAHASRSRGRVVSVPLRGVLLRDLKLIRRLTIGETIVPGKGHGK